MCYSSLRQMDSNKTCESRYFHFSSCMLSDTEKDEPLSLLSLCYDCENVFLYLLATLYAWMALIYQSYRRCVIRIQMSRS